MSLGTYEALVNEVAALFRGIAASASFPNGRAPDIAALDDATQAAWEETHGAEELTWTDIRSREMRAVWDAAYNSEEFKAIEPAVRGVIKDLSRSLVTRFRGSELELIGEDVVADMQNIVYARAVSGSSNSFFEDLFEAYKRDYWPCGWHGDYPEGRVRTFASSSR